jgi:hypothetical protein
MKTASRLILALTAAALAMEAARAEENLQLIEQKIKAGLIYNFLKYTQWPQGSARQSGALVVCLFGGDPFDGSLQPMGGRTVNQRTIEIRTIGGAADASPCALLVVHVAKKSEWPQLKSALAGKDVLTVSDIDNFTAEGGMIEFTRIDNRIGVEINADAVTASHLVVQDRLLKLASAIHAGGGQP